MTTRGFVAALLGAACVVEVAGQAETPAPTVFRLGITTTRYRNESEGATFTDYPDFDSMTPYRTRNWDLDFNSVDLAWGADDYGNLASRSTGYLTVTKAGTHSFSLENSAGSRMFIDGVKIIDAGGVGTVDLSIGEHEVRIEFYYIFQKPDVFLKWLWQQPGEEVMVVVPRQSVDPLPCLTVATSGLCQAGMRTAMYRADTGVMMLTFPNFETHEPCEIWKQGRNVDFSHNEWSSAGYDNHFASRHSGYLLVDVAGNYTFSLTSDDGSRMFLDGKEIIWNGKVHAEKTVSATVSLEAGTRYEVRIEYFEFQDGQMLKWEWLQPGKTDKVVVPLEVLIPLYCLRVDATGNCLPESSYPTL